ncbi:tetratricopeptide repeat protein [Amaricoccus macauensis]|uniref:tetratricopeptide repeat protein n=1 Tax=Amaricoccus macauensis TaxID=57001 RepID=UPI003C7DDEA2
MPLLLRALLAAPLLALGAWAAPALAQHPDYVGSETCIGCHTEAAEAWEGSHHDLAWTPATPENVLGDFNDTAFSHDGMTARFRTGADGSYSIEVTEADGSRRSYAVHSVVGVEPLQQYLLQTEPGRLQSFDVVWDTEKREWFHLYPDQHLTPADGLHWTGPYKTWNGRCAVCHATDFEANYDITTRSYASTQTEIGVGCEACHGPGADHLAWAETPESPYPAIGGFSADLSDPETLIQQCAGCHSRREAYLDSSPLPGTPYHDSYNLSQLRPGLYEADGQIIDEVYVYGSFLQSKMYAKGVTCTNCHEPHTAELRAEGNAVCTQCHSPAANPAFPTLREAEYDTPEHHHHAPGSEGAQCKSCHMTERVYMGNDWRADHSFRVPRPDLAAETGAPDACTTCHDGESPDWAARQIADWFPESDHRGPHYGQVLAAGRMNASLAAPDLAELALDDAEPGIVRATALWLLEQSGEAAQVATVAPLLEDPDPMIRAAAVGAQRLAPPQERVLSLVDLLDDPARNVRIATARALLDAPIARLPGPIAEDMRNAMGDWQGSMQGRLDFPETHLQMAGMALTMRNFAAAESAFREVVTLDAQMVDAWVMLARIAAASGDMEKATSTLEEAVAANPEDLALASFLTELRGEAYPDLLPPGR